MVDINPIRNELESNSHELGNESSVISVLGSTNLKSLVQKDALINVPPKHDSQVLSVTDIFELYDRLRDQHINTEKNTVYNQLNNNIIKSLIKDKQNQRSSSSIQLDLLTEDVLEMIQESSVSMSLPRIWFNPLGEIVTDPTVNLMKKLQENSNVEAALQCIIRTNTMIEEAEKQQSNPTESTNQNNSILSHASHHPNTIESSNTSIHTEHISRTNIQTITTTSNSNNSSSSSNSTTADNTPLTPSSSSDDADSAFLALPYLRDHYLYTHNNESASLLEKQFFADLLANVTENTFQLAKKLDKRRHRHTSSNDRQTNKYMNRYNDPYHEKYSEKYSSSFLFLSKILADVKHESRDLVRPFLSSPVFPELPALQKARLYLLKHGEFQFHSSSGSGSGMNCSKNSGNDKSASSNNNTNNTTIANTNSDILQQQQDLSNTADITMKSTATAGSTDTGSIKAHSQAASSGLEDSAEIPSTSELDDVAAHYTPLPLPLEALMANNYHQQQLSATEGTSSAEGSSRAHETSNTMAPHTGHCLSSPLKGEKTTSTLPTTSTSNPYTSLPIHTADSRSSGAVELLSLLADRVCSGLHAQTVANDNQSRQARRQLRQRVEDTIAAERACIQSSVALCNTITPATSSDITTAVPATTTVMSATAMMEPTQRYDQIKQEIQPQQQKHVQASQDVVDDRHDIPTLALSSTAKKVGMKRGRPSKLSASVDSKKDSRGIPNGVKTHTLISHSLLPADVDIFAGTATVTAKKQRLLASTSPSEVQSSSCHTTTTTTTTATIAAADTTSTHSSLQSSSVGPEHPQHASAHQQQREEGHAAPTTTATASICSSDSVSLRSISCDDDQELIE